MTLYFLILTALVVVLIKTKLSKTNKKENTKQFSISEMCDHISMYGVAPFEDENINPLDGELCLLRYENAQLYGFKTIRGVESVIPSGSGTLYLTTDRIIFAGEMRTHNIKIKDVVRVQCTSSRLSIHIKNKTKPVLVYHPLAPVFEYTSKLVLNNALILNHEVEV